MIRILILAANPRDTDRLRLDEEVREIQDALRQSINRDDFEVIQRWAVRVSEIQQVLLNYPAEIVHFSGHGDGENGLILVGDSGEAQLVRTEALANLFSLFKDTIKCVCLNACYSEIQAKAIHESIPIVIGMNQRIDDTSAIKFAKGFYCALGANRTIEDAFKLGRNVLDFENNPDISTPVMMARCSEEPFIYVDRPPIETTCYEALLKPNALVRIKAPSLMGKTHLVARVFRQLDQQPEYRKVYLNLNLADETELSNLNQFLRWFCTGITQNLGLPDQIADQWNERVAPKMNCTKYFEKNFLPSDNSALILCLDEVERIFPYSVASEFLGLLRGWHEQGKIKQIWRKLRLIVVHSTESYIPLNINRSPFNVGLQINLPEFTLEQIQNLSALYGLALTEENTKQLMEVVGGHPYLVDQAFSHLKNDPSMALSDLLQAATSEDTGIYRSHLRHLWRMLEEHPELMNISAAVVKADHPVRLKSEQSAYQLFSMGVVRFAQDNQVVPRCNLYQKYFRKRLAFQQDHE